MKVLKIALFSLLPLVSTSAVWSMEINSSLLVAEREATSPFSINNDSAPILLAADNTKKAKKQLEGHRSSVREHVEKYKKYPAQQDKDFALKTIRNVQSQIAKIKAKNPNLGSSWEDSWKP